MNDILKIRCSHCGAILSVQNIPGIEARNVRCPKCGIRSRIADLIGPETQPGVFNRPAPKPVAQGTQFGFDNPQNNVGSLVAVNSGVVYPLAKGRNVIGRKANGSSATVQVDCPRCLTSREHLVIDVAEIPGRGIVHYVSLFKNGVNATSIGSTTLKFGDRVVLSHGDIIRLPDLDLRFDLGEAQGTRFGL